jgi:molecular chaperone DnaK
LYQTEKTLKEHGGKVPDGDRKAIEAALEELRKVKDSGSKDEIQATLDALQQASHKLAEAMYKDARTQQPGGEEAAGQAVHGAAEEKPGKKGGDDNVVDADYEEVK